MLEVLAAQMKHQHRGGVGVAHQGSQQLAGLGVVVTGLAAAKGMGEGVQTFDAAGDQILVVLHHLFGDIIDAAHSGDDPDFVADGGPAVLRRKPIKVSGCTAGRGARSGAGL